MPRKPVKITRKRPAKAAKHPKAPKTTSNITMAPKGKYAVQPLPAPKTRIESEVLRVAEVEPEWSFPARSVEPYILRGDDILEPSRWSRLWAWLGRFGRP